MSYLYEVEMVLYNKLQHCVSSVICSFLVVQSLDENQLFNFDDCLKIPFSNKKKSKAFFLYIVNRYIRMWQQFQPVITGETLCLPMSPEPHLIQCEKS